jgi:tetratricopeptide (TPR) repeat protein/MinD-like ATPase involved in chromosome partitioning or flagellar assembly
MVMGEAMGQVVTFYSYKGGTGRSMALANVAWILAANGRRVLVADWDLDSPGLQKFFKPFLSTDAAMGEGIIDLIWRFEDEARRSVKRSSDWHEEMARVERYTCSLGWDFPGNGTLDFLPAGRQNSDYSAQVSGLDWDDFYKRLKGAVFFDALRDNMRRRYDYTFIDSRTGLSDVAQICTAHLPDIVVDCFTLSDQGIDGAAMMARQVPQGRRPIRVLPVPMRTDPAEKEKADAGRALARRRMPELPGGLSDAERDRYWNSVEVPYQAYYAYEETLATFGDVPGTPRSLLAAYESLAASISGGEVQALPRMREEERLRWRRRYERRIDVPRSKVVLSYAAQDQVWADWAGQTLAAVGVEVTDPGPIDIAAAGNDAPVDARLLCLVSSSYETASTGVPDRRWGSQLPRLGVYLPGRRVNGTAFASARSLAGLSGEDAVSQLIALVGGGDHPDAARAAKAARYPGDEPDWIRLPARKARFTGRVEDLQRLRDQLAQGGSPVALVALRGMGGVGKTQLAQEYAHRYRTAYDLVWWISAEQQQSVNTAIIELASELKLPSYAKPDDTVRATIAALRRGDKTGRWLIVLDNADAPDDILDLLSEGKGQVIVTSRNQDWGARVSSLEVDVFRRRESIEHLRTQLPSMTREDAGRVAEALGDLPIAVDTAGAWLAETGTAVEEYLAELDRSTAVLEPVNATFRLALKRLEEQAPAAHRLLQICSIMAPEIALEFLYSDQMAEALKDFATSTSISDRTERAVLVRQLTRLSLITLDVAAGQIQIHRLLQTFVREGIPGDQLGDIRYQAQLVLARNRPAGEVDDPGAEERFRPLWRHLQEPHLRAAESTDESVRALYVDWVRFLSRRRDWALAYDVGTVVEDTWREMLERFRAVRTGTEDARGSDTLEVQLFQLRHNLANIFRDQGRYEEALSVNESVLERQTALLGSQHANTLMTAGSLSADLRALGRYREALEREEKTYAVWVDKFGPDHPRALASANNLAVSHRAVGNYRRARALDESVVEGRYKVLGPTHELTLHSMMCLGRDLREAGDYQESVLQLREALESCRRSQGPDDKTTLNTQVSLAVSLRSAGERDEPLPLLEDALTRLSTHYGPRTPDTLACRMNLGEHLLVMGRVREAVREMEAVVEAYEKSLKPRHPVLSVSWSNLSGALRVAGDLEAALRLTQMAVEGCKAMLGWDHPFTLAVAMNASTCLAEHGQEAEAVGMMRNVTQHMNRVLEPDHPDSLTGVLNLDLMASRAASYRRPPNVVQALEKLAARLGEAHPTVTRLRAGELAYRLIDPSDPF